MDGWRAGKGAWANKKQTNISNNVSRNQISMGGGQRAGGTNAYAEGVLKGMVLGLGLACAWLEGMEIVGGWRGRACGPSAWAAQVGERGRQGERAARTRGRRGRENVVVEGAEGVEAVEAVGRAEVVEWAEW